VKTTSNFLAVAGLLALAFCVIVLMRANLYQSEATGEETGVAVMPRAFLATNVVCLLAVVLGAIVARNL
jgi:hypothetical protein